MRALIIEDEVLVAFLIEEILRAVGCSDIRIAATEAEAIEAAREYPPDLITSDARLSEGCGVTAALAICEERPVPVVFVTGNAANVRRRIEDPVLVEKPFTHADLEAAIALAQVNPSLRRVTAKA